MNTSVNTENLLKLILDSNDLEKDWNTLSSMMDGQSFHDYLSELIAKRGVDASGLGEAALISRSFAYQLISGVRVPGREIILRAAIGLGFTVDETQRLLKLADRGILYPKLKRDAAIIYCLANGLGLANSDKLLRTLGLEPLI